MSRTLAALVLALHVLAATAQYGAGGSGGTWEGIWGVNSQPAAIVLHRDRAEIGLLRVGADLHNSYLQLRRESLGLFGFGQRVQVNTDEAHLREVGSTGRAIVLDLRVQGPSFSMRLGRSNALAFTTSARGVFNALDLDLLARKFGVDTLKIEPGRSRRMEEIAIRSAAMSWLEFGPTYGHTLHLNGHTRLHAAASAKYALGVFGAKVELRPALLSGLVDSTQAISEVDLRYSLALPEGVQANGSGWNTDIGGVLEFMRRDTAGSMQRHWLRIGVAVTDLGSITFNRQARHHVIRDGATTVHDIEELDVSHINQLDTALSRLLLNDQHASLVGKSFTMGLPAAAHGSVDISPYGAWAVRVEAVFGLRTPPDGTTIRDQLAIVPRFETRMVCVAAPITIDRFGNTAFGLSARIGGFMIGSDRIGGLFGLNDVSGADLYFGAKVRLRARAD